MTDDLSTISVPSSISIPANDESARPSLRFKLDGTMKIIQFTDTHHNVGADPRTIAGMNMLLDHEQPDFVLITGDCVPGDRCETVADLRTAIDEIAQPMEKRQIPWAITFGNHDFEHLSDLGLSKADLMAEYMKYRFNMNNQGPKDVHGVGNDIIEIGCSISDDPAFGIWLLDSNMYAPEEAGGQKMGGYDWIHSSQIRWYSDLSLEMERRYGRAIPSLMFFHIPLREFIDVYDAGLTTGEQNEVPCPPSINSGLFTSLLERGDVRGVFVGHEHVNTYVGDWYGVKLGYSGGTGYSTYGLSSDDDSVRNRLRGARIFEIDENNPSDFQTAYVTFDCMR